MKTRNSLLWLAAVVAITACNKNDSTEELLAAEASISFVRNGNFKFETVGDLDSPNDLDSGVLIRKKINEGDNYKSTTLYMLEAHDGYKNRIWLYTSPASSLTVGKYQTSYSSIVSSGGLLSEASFLEDGTNYSYLHYKYPDNQVTITITSIHDGLADGTFSAKINRYNDDNRSVAITDGVFKNVRIVN